MKTFIIFLMVALQCGPLAAAGENEVSAESRPAESNGIAFVIGSSRNSFESNESLALRITFRNTTASVIWLPRYLQALHLEDTGGKTFTGASTRYGGASLPQLPPIRLQPHESQNFVATFQRFGFVQGDMDYHAAQDGLFRMARELFPDEPPGIPQFPLAPGLYHLTVELQVLASYRQALPKDFDSWKKPKPEDEYGILDLPKDFDSAFLWKDDVMRSDPIEIRIVAPETGIIGVNSHDRP